MLADVVARFQCRKVGVALALTFLGTKMLLLEVYKIPIGVSLEIPTALIWGSVLASWAGTKRDAASPPRRIDART